MYAYSVPQASSRQFVTPAAKIVIPTKHSIVVTVKAGIQMAGPAIPTRKRKATQAAQISFRTKRKLFKWKNSTS